MNIKRLSGKTAYLIAAGAVALTAFLGAGRTANAAEEELREASFCSFVIPPQFEPGQEKGLFINTMHPMESSTIRYSVYYNGLDVVLTNKEKQELKEEATLDMSHQQYGFGAEDTNGMSTLNEAGEIEDEVAEAAVVGVDDMDTYGE